MRAGFLRARNYGLKAVSRGLVMQAAPNSWPNGGLVLPHLEKSGTQLSETGRGGCALPCVSLKPLARYGLDYVMIARYDTAKREWQNLVEDVEQAVGYLHRQMDRQDVGCSSSGLSRKGGQI